MRRVDAGHRQHLQETGEYLVRASRAARRSGWKGSSWPFEQALHAGSGGRLPADPEAARHLAQSK